MYGYFSEFFSIPDHSALIISVPQSIHHGFHIQEDASESSPSVTQLKSATSDLDLRLSASSENEGEASGSKDSAQQLADYLKWRDQASDLSLSDEGSIKMNGVHSNESVDLTNVEENCVRGYHGTLVQNNVTLRHKIVHFPINL